MAGALVKAARKGPAGVTDMAFTPTVIGSGSGGYAFLTRTRDSQMETFARSPEIARDVAYFKEKIKTIETVDALMDNRRLLELTLGAFGLEEDISNRAFVRQVLESDLNDPTSLANRLSEKKYLTMARSLNFAGSARLPGTDATEDVKPALQALSSADDLFKFDNAALLTRTLEVFDISGDAGREVFLKQVMTSNLDDPTSLVNRLENKSYAGLARAFQGVEPRLDASFLRGLSDDIGTRLEAVETAEELTKDTGLLRSALKVFGLEDQVNNTFFLQSVLNSDLDDPNSFANRQRDTRYAELAAVFDFQGRLSERDSIYGFADLMADKREDFASFDDLIADEEVLDATLRVFGLERDSYLAQEDNLRAVMESDLTDDASVANTALDPRYAALAGVFGFGEILGGETQENAQDRLTNMIDAVDGQRSRIKTGEEFISQAGFLLATMNFFDLPSNSAGGDRLRRVALSDPEDPNSLLNLVDDTRYGAFYDAMDFKTADEGRTYPIGFAASLTEAYLERQFEAQVGEVDPNMRIALSLERELTQITQNVSSNNARWFSVMSSSPLRAAFESAFRLPSSFGSLDLDRQLEDLKDRSESILGTSNIDEILAADKIDALREGFLTGIATSTPSTSGVNAALVLLGNVQTTQQTNGYDSVLGIVSA